MSPPSWRVLCLRNLGSEARMAPDAQPLPGPLMRIACASPHMPSPGHPTPNDERPARCAQYDRRPATCRNNLHLCRLRRAAAT